MNHNDEFRSLDGGSRLVSRRECTTALIHSREKAKQPIANALNGNPILA
jgi:hypothetical protein